LISLQHDLAPLGRRKIARQVSQLVLDELALAREGAS